MYVDALTTERETLLSQSYPTYLQRRLGQPALLDEFSNHHVDIGPRTHSHLYSQLLKSRPHLVMVPVGMDKLDDPQSLWCHDFSPGCCGFVLV